MTSMAAVRWQGSISAGNTGNKLEGGQEPQIDPDERRSEGAESGPRAGSAPSVACSRCFAGLQNVAVPSVFIRVHPWLRIALADSCSKTGFFRASVKKTYLTSLYLTVVLANKTKGFVPERNPFPEAVKNPAFLLKWPTINAKG
jgi:hypothetical protein